MKILFRLVAAGYKVVFQPDPYNRFTMFKHDKDIKNPKR